MVVIEEKVLFPTMDDDLGNDGFARARRCPSGYAGIISMLGSCASLQANSDDSDD